MLLVPNGTPLTAGSVSAPVTAIATSPPRTRARESAERHLDGGAIAGVGHQPVGQRVRAAVGGPERVTPVRQSGLAEVFDQRQRSGAQDFQCRGHDGPLPTEPLGTEPTCPVSAARDCHALHPTARRRCARSVANRRATPGDRRLLNSPASATDPVGTLVRGSDRRGTLSRGSPPTR